MLTNAAYNLAIQRVSWCNLFSFSMLPKWLCMQKVEPIPQKVHIPTKPDSSKTKQLKTQN